MCRHKDYLNKVLSLKLWETIVISGVVYYETLDNSGNWKYRRYKNYKTFVLNIWNTYWLNYLWLVNEMECISLLRAGMKGTCYMNITSSKNTIYYIHINYWFIIYFFGCILTRLILYVIYFKLFLFFDIKRFFLYSHIDECVDEQS